MLPFPVCIGCFSVRAALLVVVMGSSYITSKARDPPIQMDGTDLLQDDGNGKNNRGNNLRLE